MAPCLQRMTRSRVIPVALAVTWLPYIATRCVENPVTHEECPVLLRAARVHAEAYHSRADPQGGQGSTHHERQGKHSQIRSCCELTGKCNSVSAAVSSLDPRASLAILPAVTRILTQA